MKERMQVYAEELMKEGKKHELVSEDLHKKIKDLGNDEMLVIPIGESRDE